MSLILKGIDLPKDGYKDIRISSNGIAYEITSEGYYKEYTDGQAIQIPNPHGDLIDRNQVFTYSHRDVQNLEEVPVILEGEEW